MISVVQGFKVMTRDAVDNRILLSKSEMRKINDSQMPEKYFAICKDDGKLYLYDKSRVVAATLAEGDESEGTGKFTLFSAGTIESISVNGVKLPIADMNVELPLITNAQFGLAKAGKGISANEGVISIDFNAVDDESLSYKKVNFNGATINGGNISIIEDEIKTRVRLWKDTDENFESIKDSLIPLDGEIIIVETANDGIRYKVGNGTTTYANLPFADQTIRDQLSGIVVQGYYHDGQFFTSTVYDIKIVPYSYKLYIDLPNDKLYYYSDDDKSYHSLVELPTASATKAGIMKLYDTTGDNEDGTMTQKSITSEIAKKFAVTAGTDEDLIFTAGE